MSTSKMIKATMDKNVTEKDVEEILDKSYFLMHTIKEPIFPKDVYSVGEVATLLHKSEDTIFKLARREQNPFPIRYFERSTRGGIVLRDEMLDWLKHSTRLASEKE
jgi:hypothetical protein